LGLPGVHQTINASLAVALCKTVFTSVSTQLPEVLQPYHDSKLGEENVPKAFVSALERTRWPGRCQSVIDPTSTDTRRTTWFLDGAHTVESLTSCGEWVFSKDGFSKQTDTKKTRVLVFNCTSERSAHALLDALLKAGKGVTGQTAAAVGQGFDKVIFCTNVTYTDGHFKGGEYRYDKDANLRQLLMSYLDLTSKAIDPNDLSALATQHACADAWAEFVPEASKEQVTVVPSIQHAVNMIREAEKANDADVEVLVAGSLHLVGGVMEVAGLAERALSVA
jgi:folylpolyglutamate synthase